MYSCAFVAGGFGDFAAGAIGVLAVVVAAGAIGVLAAFAVGGFAADGGFGAFIVGALHLL